MLTAHVEDEICFYNLLFYNGTSALAQGAFLRFKREI